MYRIGRMPRRGRTPRILKILFALFIVSVFVFFNLVEYHKEKWPRIKLSYSLEDYDQKNWKSTYHHHRSPILRGFELPLYDVQIIEKSEDERTYETEAMTIGDEGFKELKKVLFWNERIVDINYYFGVGRQPYIDAGCEYTECYNTRNRTLFEPEELDAVIWNMRAKDDRSLPKRRSAHTYHVAYITEPPFHVPEVINHGAVHYNDYFNWTISYRSDADIYRPYGTVIRERHFQVTNYRRTKTKMAAWFVSNCKSSNERDLLAKSLQKYFRVDVYGKCGKFQCSRNDDSKCFDILERDYKFYLSFENSLCVDYVTEKFFNVLNLNIVPVVYGLGYENFDLPPHSYIDVLDFQSVRALAEYLIYLDDNDEAYEEYFKWKGQYKVIRQNVVWNETFCNLCERLHMVETYPDHDMFNTKPLVFPPNKFSRIKMPKPFVNRGVVSKGTKKQYKDMWNWFITDSCVYPQNNTKLHNFVRDLNYSGKPNKKHSTRK